MLTSFGNAYAYLFGWPALAKINKGIFYMAARGLGLHNYGSPRISGETLAIRNGLLGCSAAPIVFDVGANRGEWLSMVLGIRADSKVHAFEPQSSLAKNISDFGLDISVNNCALGDKPGVLQLYDYMDHPGSEHASLIPGVIDGIHNGTPRVTNVEVRTVDDYCQATDIQRIDLLKIDVEGYELNVLRGAQRMLSERRVGTIQFEFNEMNIAGHNFMADFERILKPTHQLHRILPHGLLRLRENSQWWNEQFIYQNIIALPK